AEQHERTVLGDLGEARAAEGFGDLLAEHADAGQLLDVLVRDAGLALDAGAVQYVFVDGAQAIEERLGARGVFGRGARVPVDQIEPEPPEVELLGDRRLVPPGLTGGFGDLTGLTSADVAGVGAVFQVRHGASPSSAYLHVTRK